MTMGITSAQIANDILASVEVAKEINVYKFLIDINNVDDFGTVTW